MSLYQQGVTLKALLEHPELLNPPKPSNDKKEKKDGELADLDLFHGQSAFLGPQLWDKNMTYGEDDFQLEYMDLDEFLMETELADASKDESNTITATQGNQGNNSVPAQPPQPQEQKAEEQEKPVARSPGSELDFHISPEDLALVTIPVENTVRSREDPCTSPGSKAEPVSVEFEVENTDMALVTIPGQTNFDPKRKAFSEEELRPQPMIKKSKKVFVPDDCKDDKYWSRRKKNNVAAKRSRDARRVKENQIAMRAAYLEKENVAMKEELNKFKEENRLLKERLAKYEMANTT